MSMPKTMEELEPQAVWRFFAGLTRIPRPSKHEERVRRHVLETAGSLGLKAREDAQGNVIIDVPASPGCEAAPVTVLQGHLDMVCEKNSDTAFDFDREAIRTVVEKDAKSGELIVRADGTTLGADNGIGVALALAAATDKSVKHGPLELLFTLDEEAGMSGAKALTPQSFRGRRMLNLDSEEDDTLYIGCAGGTDTNLTWRLAAEPIPAGLACATIKVHGLRGGHSGGDIHENRANANKLLGRVLASCGVDGLRIASINGGSKRNAIPREAEAVVCGGADLVKRLTQAGEAACAAARSQSGEANPKVTVTPASGIAGALSAGHSRALIDAMIALPSGVLGMSRAIPGLVETSTNFSTISSTASADGNSIQVVVGMLSRSSCDAWLRATCDQIAAIGRLAGAEATEGNQYPGWQPDVDSPLLAICRRVYESTHGHAPQVTAIHAGLECGIIAERVGKMDTVSFGPRITGAHSPEERVYVASVARSWTYLKALLAELGRG